MIDLMISHLPPFFEPFFKPGRNNHRDGSRITRTVPLITVYPTCLFLSNYAVSVCFSCQKAALIVKKTQGSCRNNRLALDFVSFFFRKSQRNRPRDFLSFRPKIVVRSKCFHISHPIRSPNSHNPNSIIRSYTSCGRLCSCT